MTSNPLKFNTVRSAIKAWSIRFKDRTYTETELTILAKEYLEDLQHENFSEELFNLTMKYVRKKAEFFPSLKLVLECKKDAVDEMNRAKEAQKRNLPLLPQPKDNAGKFYNRFRQEIMDAIKKGLSFADASTLFEKVNDLQKKRFPEKEASAEFRTALNAFSRKGKGGRR